MCAEEDFCLETYKTKPTYRECCQCGEIATLGFGAAKRTPQNPEAVKFWFCEECADMYVVSEKEKIHASANRGGNTTSNR